MVNSISPKDFYCVYNDFNVASKSQELNLLYLPLIGSDAVKLYQFLGTKILGDCISVDISMAQIKELFTL